MSYDAYNNINTDNDWTKRGEGLAIADNGALIRAAKEGDAAKIRILIGDGADIDWQDANGWTALFWAVRNCHVKAAAELVIAGADTAIEAHNGLTPLYLAVKGGSPLIINIIAKAGGAKK